jgi:FtsP/CotA-like multicopper oxidase with cupredoxin domain
MRVYLPSTLPLLAEVLRSGAIGPAPLDGFAVTPALREAYASGDEEELEYAAMTAAARASLRLIQPETSPRRAVLAAEIPVESVHWTAGDPAAVTVTTDVPVAWIASGHVDGAEAEPDVAAAAEAVAAADAGDDDAAFTVDGAEGHELLWYATQELTDL